MVNRDDTIALSYNFLDDYSIGAYGQLLMEVPCGAPARDPCGARVASRFSMAVADDVLAGSIAACQVLDLHLAALKYGHDQAADRVKTIQRLQMLGFARERGGFPGFTLRAQASELADASWEAFFASNAPPGAAEATALPPGEFEEAMGAWVRDGGVPRMLKELQRERVSANVPHAANIQ